MNDVSGTSMADVLRVGLDKTKPAVEEAFNGGYDEGYEYARREFEVTLQAQRVQ